ncbi:hypothetical protein BST92_03785 [Nonlabens arenilitoris]|uniref:Uncharacterized protein n=1 Tax=Nonlabens arenilitoris TaxID=1217969 RepID=A0A2S7U7Z1_9FLAO|nr:hypothetical protein [Nonlabens arenilitoris]PQJ31098.1 hypothetical protein BST92_03785 [Nonlabens arenilitoris]
MLNTLETSILQTAIAALDADALLRLKSNLDNHVARLNPTKSIQQLDPVEIITSPKYREQFITHIANGGDCQNFIETVCQQWK